MNFIWTELCIRSYQSEKSGVEIFYHGLNQIDMKFQMSYWLILFFKLLGLIKMCDIHFLKKTL